jgi:hypothetical protein
VIAALVVARRSGQASHPSAWRILSFVAFLGPSNNDLDAPWFDRRASWFMVEMVGATCVYIKRYVEGWLACPERRSTTIAAITAQRAGWLACPAVVDRDLPLPTPSWIATALSYRESVAIHH